jgi:RND family efflux transporter MFP subunit
MEFEHGLATRRALRRRTNALHGPAAVWVVLGALVCAGCEGENDRLPEAAVRPVRTASVERPSAGTSASFTGRIEAQDHAALSFRIGGRLAERDVGVGAQVVQDQIVASLEPQDQLNALRAARAAATAARGRLTQADNHFQRQQHLLARNVTTRADFEAAEQARRAAAAQVEAAEAQVHSTEELVSFTTLSADASGVVTAVGAEPGEVVQAGRMIVMLARREGRDAVFDLPADVLRSSSQDIPIAVSLPGEPGTIVAGRVREVSPQADPVTRLFQVRVGLADPPPSWRLGASVNGTIGTAAAGLLAVPVSALVQSEGKASVFVVDPKTSQVASRPVVVARKNALTALIAHGLAEGETVVTAGVGQLQAGQKVRLVGTES